MSEQQRAWNTDELVAEYQELRPRLIGVAYGLLGTLPEAEDAVQEAWIRLQGTNTDAIEDVTGWLVTTTSRLALDTLRSARRQRENYIGPWLPEPVETGSDPAERATLADSLSWAMLVVLETLTPSERAAFVLHDVFSVPFDEVGTALGRSPQACRKLAARARQHVRERKPRFDVDPGDHREVVEAFGSAMTDGDLQRLLQLLDPDAVLISDGGGLVQAALNPILGHDKIARFLAGVRPIDDHFSLRHTIINGNPALVVFSTEHTETVFTLGIRNGRIRTIDAVRNPHKFHGLSHSQN
ncbi:RNA polymerase sigma factor SigJ [Haloglycomyces albus]|uniref:RNA polymerase sigma factor SigJ n=1 Tax=Haloglycomyces albus TaxID=526067 RepID=UPI00046D7BAD|nr:RNA polymerase sigma factor SigJ [Haloglycomyces albus]